jgi:hypothetical protein
VLQLKRALTITDIGQDITKAWYIQFESREISKGIPRKKRGLAIWTEMTILILKTAVT